MEHEISTLIDKIRGKRDLAMFLLMLRCGLRVKEVAKLSLSSIDLRNSRIFVYCGKWNKDRVVYMSDDTYWALSEYLRIRPSVREKRVFLVEKGLYKYKPISIRGIQKRMEYYANQTGVKVSCHRLRHTMATQLLNADAMLATVQQLLGHECVSSTQQYAKISNPKVRRDYFKAIEYIMAEEKT